MAVEKLRLNSCDIDALQIRERVAAIEQEKVVRILLDDSQRRDILQHVQSAMVGGKSAIRSRDNRRENLGADQLVGLSCEAAFAIWSAPLHSGGFAGWLERRAAINLEAFTGDGGADFQIRGTTPVDVKGSNCKVPLTAAAALSYNLTATRATILGHVAYVQALTQPLPDSYMVPREVLLIGWLWGAELVGREDRPGFAGWSARGNTLHRMETL